VIYDGNVNQPGKNELHLPIGQAARLKRQAVDNKRQMMGNHQHLP
jgi:hypothetical protein